MVATKKPELSVEEKIERMRDAELRRAWVNGCAWGAGITFVVVFAVVVAVLLIPDDPAFWPPAPR